MSHRLLRKDYVLGWMALVVIGLSCRPLTPVDETRAVSVAWEMWQRHDFLVPYLNGETYSHKPPLLQWCIHLLWLLFGVGEFSARLVVPLFTLGNLALSAGLARRLWRDDDFSSRLVPWILLAMPLWAMWTSLTLYDMLITFFSVLGLHGIIRVAQGETLTGWSLVGLAIGGGVLAKGPVILLLVLPVALTAPWWAEARPPGGWGRWYGGLLGAIVLGTVIALSWAIPAGAAGGEEYRNAIFWGQSAGRIAHSFAHRRPIWWYLEWLPVLSFPWVLWPPLWRAAKNVVTDQGLRFCAVHAGSVLILFSLISGKQPHYLLPMFPSLALLAARLLSQGVAIMSRRDPYVVGLLLTIGALIFVVSPWFDAWTGAPSSFKTLSNVSQQASLAAKLTVVGAAVALLLWRPRNLETGVRLVAIAMTGVLFAAHLVYRDVGWRFYDMRPFAEHLKTVEEQGSPVAHWGKYHGDFNFLGRLQNPLLEIDTRVGLQDWIQNHPHGYVVLEYRPKRGLKEEGVEFAQHYRGSRRVALWRADELAGRPDLLAELID